MRVAGAVAGIAASHVGFAHAAPATGSPSAPAAAPDPDSVLRALLAGNQRFVAGQPSAPRRRPEDFAGLAEGQNPVAVVVGCADSRVPPEIVFDQGVGDLFVVRVAGNVVSGAGSTVKGSIEYAVAELGVSLIMVLGHSSCGAIKAALKHIEARDALPGSIKELVNLLQPTVARIKGKPGDPLDNAIRANVQVGVNRLKTLDPVLAPAIKQSRLKVVAALYELRTGEVTQIA
jgi:carbonic anhydrase